MECATILIDFLTLLVTFGAFLAACLAGYAAWGAYQKQGEQLGLAKDQHHHFVKSIDRSNRANSPNLVSVRRASMFAITEYRLDSGDIVSADIVVNSGHFNFARLSLFLDEDDPRLKVWLVLHNLRPKVEILNLTAFSISGEDPSIMLEAQKITPHDVRVEGEFYAVGY
ncbi:MAG: hypothetical protein EOP84_32270, partial [Verrucomicrobiaceae bacterium]